MKGTPEHDPSDRELARAILRGGSEIAFRRLYRRHTPRLFQLLLRMFRGSEADAEDAAQETWIRAMEGLDGFRWESKFSTWLTGIGINVARDRLRKAGRRRDDAQLDAQRSAVGSTPPRDEGVAIDLERAIGELPDGYRTVLLLHDVEGMTHKEIGRHLEISEGTSKSQLHNARLQLRTMLGWASGS